MTPPDPPEWLLGDYARAAFFNGCTRCSEMYEWKPLLVPMLVLLAEHASLYVQLVREIAENPPERISDEQRELVVEFRLCTRELMAEDPLIDRAAVNAGTLRADGLDSDIAALCDISPVQ